MGGCWEDNAYWVGNVMGLLKTRFCSGELDLPKIEMSYGFLTISLWDIIGKTPSECGVRDLSRPAALTWGLFQIAIYDWEMGAITSTCEVT